MLNHILRVGDRVRMKGVPNGTLGTIAGRERIHGYIQNRYPVDENRLSGIYSFDSSPIVLWDEYPDGVDPMDPEYSKVAAWNLEPADSFVAEFEERYRTEWPVRLADGSFNKDFNMSKTSDLLDRYERTGDVPETPFWELDIVGFEGQRYRIRSIDYNRWGPEKAHCYSMEEISDKNEYMNSGSTTVEPNELFLIERGNLWKELHGEPTHFHTLEEEISFEYGMGRSTEVRNLENDRYQWSLEEVLKAIEDDIVDGFTDGSVLFSAYRARRFENRDVGERLRKKTLARFNRLMM